MLLLPLGNENRGKRHDRAADLFERLGEELSKTAAIELGVNLQVGGAKHTVDDLEACVVSALTRAQAFLTWPCMSGDKAMVISCPSRPDIQRVLPLRLGPFSYVGTRQLHVSLLLAETNRAPYLAAVLVEVPKV